MFPIRTKQDYRGQVCNNLTTWLILFHGSSNKLMRWISKNSIEVQ